MEDDGAGNNKLLVVRSKKGHWEICGQIWFVLKNEG